MLPALGTTNNVILYQYSDQYENHADNNANQSGQLEHKTTSVGISSFYYTGLCMKIQHKFYKNCIFFPPPALFPGGRLW